MTCPRCNKEEHEYTTPGEYVEKRIWDIFQEVAELSGESVFELDHPSTLMFAAMAMVGAWKEYLQGVTDELQTMR